MNHGLALALVAVLALLAGWTFLEAQTSRRPLPLRLGIALAWLLVIAAAGFGSWGAYRGPVATAVMMLGAATVGFGLANLRGHRGKGGKVPSNYRIFGALRPRPALGAPLIVAGGLVVVAVVATALSFRVQ